MIPFTLPHCILQTPSLAVLDLFTHTDYNLPDDALINLPNLEKLHLSVSAAQCGFVSKMIRSCPILEELCLYEAKNGGFDKEGYSVVMDLSSPSLKTMQLKFIKAKESTKFVIDAPKLSTFVLYAAFSTYSFVKKPIALREAKIYAHTEALVSSLLPVISNVSILRSWPLALICLKGVDEEHLIFPNLTELSLLCGDTDSSSTDAFLSRFLDPPPARLLRHVKRIEFYIVDLKLGKHMLNLAKYMLNNAPALEWLVFRVFAEYESELNLDDLFEEMVFCKELDRVQD